LNVSFFSDYAGCVKERPRGFQAKALRKRKGFLPVSLSVSLSALSLFLFLFLLWKALKKYPGKMTDEEFANMLSQELHRL
jgi:hypothetical protein